MSHDTMMQRVYNASYAAFQACENKGHILWLALLAYGGFVPDSQIKAIVDRAELAAINNFWQYLN